MRNMLRKTAIYFGLRTDPEAPPPELQTPRFRVIYGLVSYTVSAAGWALIQVATGGNPLSGVAFGFIGVLANEVSQWQLRRKARRAHEGS